MINELAQNWWAVLIRGILALILGILIIAVPPIVTLAVLIIFLGAYFLVDGIFAIISAFSSKHQHKWVLIVEGILGIIIGIIVFVWPVMTALVLLFLIAIWAVVTGIMEIVFAGVNWNRGQGKWWLLIGGILSLVLGIIMFAQPAAGALALIIFVEIYLILFGIMLIALSIWLKQWAGKVA